MFASTSTSKHQGWELAEILITKKVAIVMWWNPTLHGPLWVFFPPPDSGFGISNISELSGLSSEGSSTSPSSTPLRSCVTAFSFGPLSIKLKNWIIRSHRSCNSPCLRLKKKKKRSFSQFERMLNCDGSYSEHLLGLLLFITINEKCISWNLSSLHISGQSSFIDFSAETCTYIKQRPKLIFTSSVYNIVAAWLPEA